MSLQPHLNDPDELEREIQHSIERVRTLADEMKIVQQHENAILEENDKAPRD